MLNHLPPDKMAAVQADDFFICIFLNENYRIPIQISLKLVSRSTIDNKPVFGVKPLPEPMMTQFSYAGRIMQH